MVGESSHIRCTIVHPCLTVKPLYCILHVLVYIYIYNSVLDFVCKYMERKLSNSFYSEQYDLTRSQIIGKDQCLFYLDKPS